MKRLYKVKGSLSFSHFFLYNLYIVVWLQHGRVEAESGGSRLSTLMIDIPGDLVWDLPCVQQASYLEGGPLMWMLPLYLHVNQKSGPSCSKLTMSLLNDSLKFTSSDAQICWNFFAEKMWVAFAMQKLLTFFQQKISEYCILNLLKQLMKWRFGYQQ